MRIISGKHKGRRITAPKNLPVRPTTDQAKEALFNILRNQFEFSSIEALDLFSGIGSISLELGSRGTTQITAVDSFYKNIRFLRETAEQLDLPIQTVKADVLGFLDTAHQSYDLIFADPPYEFDEEKLQVIVHKVFDNQLLLSDGLLVIEHSKHTDLSQFLHFKEKRRYGGSVFSFFK